MIRLTPRPSVRGCGVLFRSVGAGDLVFLKFGIIQGWMVCFSGIWSGICSFPEKNSQPADVVFRPIEGEVLPISIIFLFFCTLFKLIRETTV